MSMKEMLDLVREINVYSALLEEVKEIVKTHPTFP